MSVSQTPILLIAIQTSIYAALIIGGIAFLATLILSPNPDIAKVIQSATAIIFASILVTLVTTIIYGIPAFLFLRNLFSSPQKLAIFIPAALPSTALILDALTTPRSNPGGQFMKAAVIAIYAGLTAIIGNRKLAKQSA